MCDKYVVSGDIYLLLKGWAKEKNFVLPEEEFFNGLRFDFINFMKKIFPRFEFVSEKELVDGVFELSRGCDLTKVSLDKVYFQGDFYLEASRLVDKDGKDCGLGSRKKGMTIDDQIEAIKRTGVQKIAIIDDVIFSGSVMEKIIKMFSQKNIEVEEVYAGIGISEGIDHIIKMGKKILCVKTYRKVIDEVCERDFYPGVPLSGRLIDSESNIGAPYILPFGKPYEWASIPLMKEREFSLFCLHQTKKLFAEIEKYSSRKILFCDIGRQIFKLPERKEGYISAIENVIANFWSQSQLLK